MRIFKTLFIASIILITPALVRAGVMEQFIKTHGGTDDLISKIKNSTNINSCFATSSHLICLEKKKYPALDANPLARQGILKAMGMKVKHALYEKLLQKIPQNLPKNKTGAQSVYLAGVDENSNKYLLKGVDFETYFANGICYAIAGISLDKSTFSTIASKIKEPFFINDYALYLIQSAKKLVNESRYNEALDLLKELNDFHFSNPESFLLSITALANTNKIMETEEYASELLNRFSNELTASQAEELGDILLSVDIHDLAQKSYELSLTKQY